MSSLYTIHYRRGDISVMESVNGYIQKDPGGPGEILHVQLRWCRLNLRIINGSESGADASVVMSRDQIYTVGAASARKRIADGFHITYCPREVVTLLSDTDQASIDIC
jgi:hypothetical protein